MGDNEKATSVGWIGAGRMGYALIERLLDAGHDVSVYNRTRSKAEPLAERGAKLVDTPAQLADRDVVFIMVAASDDLEAVTVGEDGLLTADASPQIIIDCSTVSAAVSEKIRGLAADRGTALLAAPVSGNPKVVRSGKLTLAISGPREAYDRAEHLLRPLGRGVTYVGEGEVARLVKICHNVFLGVVAQSLAEITVLAEQGGTSRQAFLEFLNNSVMGSVFTRYKSPALGEPRLHADVHKYLAAQGLRPRPGSRPRVRRADARRRIGRRDGVIGGRCRPHHRGLRDLAAGTGATLGSRAGLRRGGRRRRSGDRRE